MFAVRPSSFKLELRAKRCELEEYSMPYHEKRELALS